MLVILNVVKFALEWQPSQAMPATGMWVDVDDAVGDPPAANGIIFGWYVIGGGDPQLASTAQPANGPAPVPAV